MEKEIKYQDRTIFYRVIGTGYTVVLIHGFGEDGEIWKAWPPQAPPKEGFATTQSLVVENSSLTKRYKFIIPDLPGSGRSEMIDDMSIEGMAEVIKTIFDHEASEIPPSGGGGAVGHSMGGYITLAFAEKYPEYLKAVGLFHSSAFADSEEKIATRRKGIEFINQYGSFEFLKTTITNLFSDESQVKHRDSIRKLIDKGNNFSPPALVSYYEAMIQRPDRTEVLRHSKWPVLFIMGKYDKAIPLEDGLRQCHLPEKSYIHILHHSGHMGMIEEVQKSNRLLEKFLDENLI